MCWMPAPTFFPLTAPADDVAPVVDAPANVPADE